MIVAILPLHSASCVTFCFFIIGWWVQCHVLHWNWCCTCWTRWKTDQCADSCCVRDAQLVSV